MHRNPQTEDELRTWITRRQVMAAIYRLKSCHNGHDECSTHQNGPCYAELLDQISATARDRALQLAATGSNRAHVWGVVTREYPSLDDQTLEDIIEDAFSHGVA
jgi:hypothetical protein